MILGDAGRMRRDMESLTRQSSVKDLLTSSWEGPEAQLSRLSNVVDNLLGQLDVQRSAPHVARAGLRDALKAAETAALGGSTDSEAAQRGGHLFNKALHGFEALVQAKQAAQKLQGDIDFVLGLRCFSGWLRVVDDARHARGEADLGARRALHVELSHRRALSLGGHLGNVAKQRLMKDALMEWATLPLLAKAVRTGYRTQSEKDNYAATVVKVRSLAKSAAYRQAYMLNKSGWDMVLHKIINCWSFFASGVGREARLAEAAEQAEAARERAKSKWSNIASSAGAAGAKAANTALVREVFWDWTSQVRETSFAKSKASMVITALADDNQGVMRRAFQALSQKCMAGSTKKKARQTGLNGALRAAEFVRDCGTTALGLITLRMWLAMVKLKKLQLLRHGLKDRLSFFAGYMDEASSEVVLGMAMTRWFEAMMLRKQNEARAEAHYAEVSFKENLQVSKERVKRWRIKCGQQVAKSLDLPLVWVSFMAWTIFMKKAKEEAIAASEFLKRQRNRELDAHIQRFQTETKPKLVRRIMDVIWAHSAKTLPEVFATWRHLWIQQRLSHKNVAWYMHRKTLGNLARTIEAWKAACIRGWLRVVGYRLGQAVARWGDDGVSRRLLLSWRAMCLARHGEISAKRVLAAHRIAGLVARVRQPVLRHWHQQAVKAAAAAAAAAIHANAKAVDVSALKSLFTKGEEASGEVKRLWTLQCHMRAWQLAMVDFAHERRRAREAKTGGRLPLMKRALQRAVGEQDRRARAERRFARWYCAPDEPLSALPKCFAAWTLATLDANTALSAEGLASSAANLSFKFREAADRLLCRAMGRASSQLLLARSFLIFTSRLRRGRQRVTMARLCAGASSLADALGARRLLIAWKGLLWQRDKQHFGFEKRTFQVQASGLARRLVRLNSCTYGFLTAAGVLVRWRAMSLRSARRILLHRARSSTALSSFASDTALLREIFGRWARSTYAIRREYFLSPLSFIFVAWKAWLQGAAYGDRRVARGPQLPSVALSSAAQSPACPTCRTVYLLDADFCRHCGRPRVSTQEDFAWPEKDEDYFDDSPQKSFSSFFVESPMAAKSPASTMPGLSPEGSRAGWRRWLRQALAEKRMHRGYRLRLVAEAKLGLRHHLQARFFGLWRSFCTAKQRHSKLDLVFIRTHGLGRMMLRITYTCWANRLETSQLAHLRRKGISEALLSCLASRTMMSSFRELLLRHVITAWSRCLGFAKAVNSAAHDHFGLSSDMFGRSEGAPLRPSLGGAGLPWVTAPT